MSENLREKLIDSFHLNGMVYHPSIFLFNHDVIELFRY